ncbi:hypothetical protein [Sphingobacterium chuzhouense]|uniref:HTH cro/C1-type domain-containing protein n=1 Tax=Sphingobacterium chuzhouense TaxID=1742264 RepID=A0ABR7XPA1_9SPHI|nr:hypothetical protein [Sphingobacterium chuzhouense]MBD1421002.1 hypothetical protein [Sphingobacterium chuzhouense]
MKVDIFSEINKELKRQKRKSPWLADEVGTSPRNMYDILNDRKDIYVGDLSEISIALKKNFFKLYVPFVDAAISASGTKETVSPTIGDEEKSTLRIGIKYPESQTEAIGAFLKQVKVLAKEYGFEVE